MRYLYDDLNRTIAMVEAYENATGPTWDNTEGRWSFSGLTDDKDRVTSFVFDGAGNIVKRVAHTATGAQTTEYDYGITTTGSDIASNRILSKVHYPNESTGDADTDSEYTVEYTYNRLGEVKTVVDQNGTTHAYTRDDLGRVTIDSVTLASGSDLDVFVLSMGYSFDDFGRVEKMTSYGSANATGTVRNEIEMRYSPLWQVERVLQAHAGPVLADTAGDPTDPGTKLIRYSYNNQNLANGNTARPDLTFYPSGSIVQNVFGTAGSSDDIMSRPTKLNFGSGGQAVEYEYLGLSAPAVVSYPIPDVQLDRTFSHDGKRQSEGWQLNGGKYPGWDNFGRVRLQAWMDGQLTEDSPGAGHPNVPTILEERYTYSKSSDRLGRLDAREGATWSAKDFGFTYDDLHRLIESQRGIASDPFAADPMATFTAGGAAGIGMSEQWDLDVLGNWQSFNTNLDADTLSPIYDNTSVSSTDETEDRNHNQANELTKRTLGSGLTMEERSYTYDDNGNRASTGLSSSNVSTNYIYDAWNRLVRVELQQNIFPTPPPPTVISRSEYNAAWWRVFHEADTDLPSDGLDESSILTYGAGWQLCEEGIDSSTDNSRDRRVDYFWGLRGIDDIVHRRVEMIQTPETRHYYHITDPLFSTVAVLDETNALVERITYDAYGKARHHPRWDIDRDGQVNGTEISVWLQLLNGGYTIGDAGYNADADPDRDGKYYSADYNQILGGQTVGLASAAVSSLDFSDNRVGYAGYLRVEEVQLYCVRFRHYDEGTGGWLQRDLLRYYDGMNQYSYVRSSPVVFTDEFGLFAGDCTKCNEGDTQFVSGGLVTTRWESDLTPEEVEDIFDALENYLGKIKAWRNGQGLVKLIRGRGFSPGTIVGKSYMLSYSISGINDAIWAGLEEIAHPDKNFSLWMNIVKLECKCSSFLGISLGCDWEQIDNYWQKCSNPRMSASKVESLRTIFPNFDDVTSDVLNECMQQGTEALTEGNFDFENK